MTIDRVFAATVPMLGMAEAMSALGAALRVRDGGARVEPEVAAGLDAVLDALGIRDAVDALDAQQTAALVGVMDGLLAQAADFATDPSRTRWDHDATSILIAQGRLSALLAPIFQRFLLPAMGADLVARLDEPGASFLDVGAGVAALSVAMCRLWPSLRAVGIDPWEPALALAREEIAAAGMSERIEVRQTTAEAMQDSGEHDLAWVPAFFVPEAVLPAAIERVCAALRPGGSAIVGLYVRPGIPLVDALADLRTLRHGGAMVAPAEVVAMLTDTGFTDVETRFDPAWNSPVVFMTGRRAR
jgi:SAM-dependent methyltransferase